MGKVKDLLIDLQNQETEQILAEELGIPFDELRSMDYKITPELNDEGLLYHYTVEFSKGSNSQVSLQRIKGIEGTKVYLAPWQLDREYDYTQHFGAIAQKKSHINSFLSEIEDIKKLNLLKLEDAKLEIILKRQIFISVIGLMETFLADIFISLTNQNPEYFKNFIETHPEFKQRKIKLRDIFLEAEKIKKSAKKVMLDTIYHNLPVVKEMYKDTFKINFPQINEVYPFVIQRHDLVHRSGKSKDGKKVETDNLQIEKLVSVVIGFIKEVAFELKIK